MAVADYRGVRTLADVALAELKELIISGKIPPGSPIRLQEQVEALSMSSVPIREALRYLERSGLVERTPHRGTHVAEMSAQDLEETYTIRQALEGVAIAFAAEKIEDDKLDEAEDLLERYAALAPNDPLSAHDIHEQLHYLLYEASGSKWLLRLIPMMWDNSERYRRLSLPVRGTIEDRIEEHRQIVEACRQHRPEAAAKALEVHLRHTFEAAIERLREAEAKRASEASEDE